MNIMDKTEKKKEKFFYLQTATKFLASMWEDSGTTFRYYRGQILRYDGRRYLAEPRLGHVLRAFLIENKIPFNNATIANIVPIIETRMMCDEREHPTLPFWAGDEKITPGNVLAFKNGLLDVSKAIKGDHTLIPHNVDWVSMVCLPHSYDPEATCPQFLQFLDESLEGDQERIDLLQEFTGYCMVGDNSMQRMLVLLGVTRAGKGTYVKVLEALLGSENITGYSLTSLADKFGLAPLLGKLVATVGEVNLQGSPHKYQIMERLNNITGDDPVSIEWKFNPNTESMRLPVRFLISCNQMPHFADDAGAVAERLLVVNFNKGRPEEMRDGGLSDRLIGEISGVTNWAIQGLARLRKNGRFSTPAMMVECVNNVRRSNSSALAFAQDCLTVHRSLNPGNLTGVEFTDLPLSDTWTRISEVVSCYQNWAQANYTSSDNKNYLFANLKAIMPGLKDPKKVLPDGSRRRVYAGIKLKGHSSLDEVIRVG